LSLVTLQINNEMLNDLLIANLTLLLSKDIAGHQNMNRNR